MQLEVVDVFITDCSGIVYIVSCLEQRINQRRFIVYDAGTAYTGANIYDNNSSMKLGS